MVKTWLRTYYYHCLPWQSAQPTQEESERFANRQRFFDALRKLPRFEVRLGQLAYRGTTVEGNRIFIQKQVDILLGSDLVLLAAKHLITDAVLLAGDSDFLPAVQIAKNEGVAITLWHGTKSPPHNELWNCADERIRLSEELIESVRLP